jgi:CrcB protein
MVPPAYAVGVGGAVGASCRDAIGRQLTHDWLPVDTLPVNVLGRFPLGLPGFSGLGGDVSLFVATGFCGS